MFKPKAAPGGGKGDDDDDDDTVASRPPKSNLSIRLASTAQMKV